MNYKKLVHDSIKFEFFWAPKSSSTEEEYEDAFAGPIKRDQTLRICIADGATESQFSKTWAQSICMSFCSLSSGAKYLKSARKRWAREVGIERDDRNWYQQESIERGAHSTFLGLSINSDLELQIEQIGDCNIFIFENGLAKLSWPIKEATSFANMPDLVNSINEADTGIRSHSRNWSPREEIVLGTDSVAKYILDNSSFVATNMNDLERVFSSMIEERGQSISDDDLTLISIRRIYG